MNHLKNNIYNTYTYISISFTYCMRLIYLKMRTGIILSNFIENITTNYKIIVAHRYQYRII